MTTAARSGRTACGASGAGFSWSLTPLPGASCCSEGGRGDRYGAVTCTFTMKKAHSRTNGCRTSVTDSGFFSKRRPELLRGLGSTHHHYRQPPIRRSVAHISQSLIEVQILIFPSPFEHIGAFVPPAGDEQEKVGVGPLKRRTRHHQWYPPLHMRPTKRRTQRFCVVRHRTSQGASGVYGHVTRTPRRPDVQSLTYPVRAAVSARLFTVGVEGPHGLRGVRRDSMVHDGTDDPCVQDLTIAPPPPAGALDLPRLRLIPL